MFPTQAQEAIAQLKNKVSAIPNDFNGRVVLLFSGGRDSSAVAAAFCHAFPNSELHLLAIDNGLLNRIDSPARQATLIKDLFPTSAGYFHDEACQPNDAYRGYAKNRRRFHQTRIFDSAYLRCLQISNERFSRTIRQRARHRISP